MFVLDPFANSFLERTGQEASATTIEMMGNVGMDILGNGYWLHDGVNSAYRTINRVYTLYGYWLVHNSN
jgi:hypothetical protein